MRRADRGVSCSESRARSALIQPKTAGVTATQDCDEYPFDSTEEGYPMINSPDLRAVNLSQNRVPGNKLRTFYKCPGILNAPRYGVKRKFLVVPTHFPTTTWLCGAP